MRAKTIFTFFLMLHSIYGHSQQVSTIVDSVGVNFRDDIIVDSNGNLYCSDFGGSNVYKRTPTGDISIFSGGFNTPNGLAFNSNNDLFVCDLMSNRIYKLDINGNFLDTVIANSPSGIIKEFDSDTMVFTAYGATDVLSKLAPDGTITQMHSGGDLNGPVGLEYDNANQLYVANFNDRKVFKVNDDTLIYHATVPGPTNGTLGFLAFGNGFLWATSWNSNKVYGISTSSIDSTFLLTGGSIGGIDGPLDTATFSSPNGIWSNPVGDTLYVSEYGTGKLRMISPDFLTSPKYSDLDISIYPNPSPGIVNITSSQLIESVSLYDLSGRTILEFINVDQNFFKLNIEQTSGLFLVEVQLLNNSYFKELIFIE